MVQYYTLFGQKVGSHVLSMAVLGTTGLLAYVGLGGKKPADNQPPINAKNKEEESFVKDFIKKAEGDKAKQ